VAARYRSGALRFNSMVLQPLHAGTVPDTPRIEHAFAVVERALALKRLKLFRWQACKLTWQRDGFSLLPAAFIKVTREQTVCFRPRFRFGRSFATREADQCDLGGADCG